MIDYAGRINEAGLDVRKRPIVNTAKSQTNKKSEASGTRQKRARKRQRDPGVVAWIALKDYQRDRILVFLDPLRDPLGRAYNVIQAKIAIGSGQLLGKGVAGATQSRLSFLPERHTDFIFAVFAEMWGFVGCLVLLLCYVLLLLRGFDIAATAPKQFERAFNEAVTNRILDDFVKACAPREAIVTAQFSARGGIALTVRLRLS